MKSSTLLIALGVQSLIALGNLAYAQIDVDGGANALISDGFSHDTRRAVTVRVYPTVSTHNEILKDTGSEAKSRWWNRDYQFYFTPQFLPVFSPASVQRLTEVSKARTVEEDDITLDVSFEHSYSGIGKDILMGKYKGMDESAISESAVSLLKLTSYSIEVDQEIPWLKGVKVIGGVSKIGGESPAQVTLVIPGKSWIRFRKELVDHGQGVPLTIKYGYKAGKLSSNMIEVTALGLEKAYETRMANTGGKEFVIEKDVRELLLQSVSNQVVLEFVDPGMENSIGEESRALMAAAAKRMESEIGFKQKEMQTFATQILGEGATLEQGRPITVMWDIAKTALESQTHKAANETIKSVLKSSNVSASAAGSFAASMFSLGGSAGGGSSSSSDDFFKSQEQLDEFKAKVRIEKGEEPRIFFRGLNIARKIDLFQEASSRSVMIKVKAAYTIRSEDAQRRLTLKTSQLGLVDWVMPPQPIPVSLTAEQLKKFDDSAIALGQGLNNISGKVEVSGGNISISNPLLQVRSNPGTWEYKAIVVSEQIFTGGDADAKFVLFLNQQTNEMGASMYLLLTHSVFGGRHTLIFGKPK
ncbi:hypothetical protein [Verrucomicrobium sp. BvORR034]|uniref:hypothetical protein n=1 Tax=Verrucomicrobium sp. BvORR034 TaxID=1396418 RepID=UPI0022410480|nr:hypothetical protein [Verrucomicrobium sp. BvORR034]